MASAARLHKPERHPSVPLRLGRGGFLSWEANGGLGEAALRASRAAHVHQGVPHPGAARARTGRRRGVARRTRRAAARSSGRIAHRLFSELAAFRPDMVAFSCNYLANVPEVVDLSIETKRRLPGCVVVVGGHSVSFTARAMLEHAGGAIDCVLRGEGEAALPALLAALAAGRDPASVAGAVTAAGEGPPPVFADDLDALQPARHLLRHRRRYFIGTLDPAASIEFSRGCPWDCAFCSAWTFYGRSYRLRSPRA